MNNERTTKKREGKDKEIHDSDTKNVRVLCQLLLTYTKYRERERERVRERGIKERRERGRGKEMRREREGEREREREKEQLNSDPTFICRSFISEQLFAAGLI